jgi:hypothetical protein
MKFELEEYHRNISEAEFLADLDRVSKEIGKNTVTTVQYDERGKYSSSTIQRRFDGWLNALKKAGLNYDRKNLTIDNENILEDLRFVAKNINKKTLSKPDYEIHGRYSISSVCSFQDME